jgi:hypothetical protein
MQDDKTSTTTKLVELEIRLPVAILRGITQIAVAKGINTKDAIREAIAKYMEEQKQNR